MEELEKIVNDISLLLVMVDAGDDMGLEAVTELLRQLQAKAKSQKKTERLAAGAEWLAAQRKGSINAEFISLAGSFISAAQAFINNSPNVKFPGEVNAAAGNQDVSADLDESLVVAFIEKHLLLLDEFEAAVVDAKFNEISGGSPDAKNFDSYVKGYIHGLKGDAGSVGLIGIERVAHALEDLLPGRDARSLSAQFLAFKEWVGVCLKAFSQKEPPSELSRDFIARLLTPQAEASPADAPPPVGQPTAAPGSAAETYQILADTEVLIEFTVEAEDHLNAIESLLLENEAHLSAEQIDTVYRGVHSLKGASSYFNLKEITETSHKLENILDDVRDGRRQLDAPLAELVLRYVDLQKKLLAEVKTVIAEGGLITRKASVAKYLQDLAAYIEGSYQQAAAAAAVESAPVAPPEAEPPSAAADDAPPSAAIKEGESQEQLNGGLKKEPARPAKLDIKTFVKVDTVRLDRLIDSIGEMLVYSSMLVRSCRELLSDNEQLIKTTHQVEKFSRELQDIGMSMRLDPIKGLFQKMSRLVWDIGKKMGKDIAFIMKGEDTEMDRNMIEKLADPLMHMVRNAIDHGIEPPDERENKGKSRRGSIELRAYHSGGSIQIEIIDDGRGLNPAKLIAKAVEKGIIPADRKLTDDEAYRLIFAPGFSTAAAITDISGRGVGMDVVRNNIESMRGHVYIQSEIGKGTIFRIELPLTLAIMDGIEAVVGKERFIVPTLSVVEIIRPTKDMLSYPFEREETFKFRDEFLPLYRLSGLLDIAGANEDPLESTVLVVENIGHKVALMVDDIVGNCQTVIKSLGALFKEGNGLAGCAVMSNGDIGLIIDIRSIVRMAHSTYRFAGVRPVQSISQSV